MATDKKKNYFRPCVSVISIDDSFLQSFSQDISIQKLIQDVSLDSPIAEAMVFVHTNSKCPQKSHIHFALPVPTCNKRKEVFFDAFLKICHCPQDLSEYEKLKWNMEVDLYRKEKCFDIFDDDLQKFHQLAFASNFAVEMFFPQKLRLWKKLDYFISSCRDVQEKNMKEPKTLIECPYISHNSEECTSELRFSHKRYATEEKDHSAKKHCPSDHLDEEDCTGLDVPKEVY